MSDKMKVGSALKQAFPLTGKFFLPYLLSVLVVGGITVGLFFLSGLDLVSSLTGTGQDFLSKIWNLLAVYLVAILGFHLVGLQTTALSLSAAREGKASWKDGLTQALGRFFPVMGSYLLLGLLFFLVFLVFGLVVGLSSLLGVVGQILMVVAVIVLYTLLFIVMIGLSFLVPVHLDQKPGVWEAVKQSWNITRGRKGRIFGFYLVSILLILVLAMVYLTALIMPVLSGETPDPSTMLGYVITMMVAGIFIGPYLTAGITLFYLDATSTAPAADLEKMVASFEEASKPVDRTDA